MRIIMALSWTLLSNFFCAASNASKLCFVDARFLDITHYHTNRTNSLFNPLFACGQKSLMLLVSMHFHRPISGLWQRDATASKPSSLSWSSRAVSRSWHCPKSCMYESTMYGTRTAQIDLVLCSQVKLSICSHAHLFQNSVRQCLCWFEKHGHQNKCKGGRDSEDKCSPNIN